MADDPFRFHPGLRPLINDPMKSRFRDFDPYVFAAQMEGLDVSRFLIPPDEREASRRKTLDRRPEGDLWVFAYGSLMWDPAFQFAEVRRAFAPGYARKFLILDTFGGRGTPGNPGMMAALDHGTGCNGLAFRISEHMIEQETKPIWNRERAGYAYQETFVTVDLSDGPVTAVTFVADYTSDIVQEVSHAARVEYIAKGTGLFGSSFEYLETLSKQFAVVGIVDADIESLLAEVTAYRVRGGA